MKVYIIEITPTFGLKIMDVIPKVFMEQKSGRINKMIIS